MIIEEYDLIERIGCYLDEPVSLLGHLIAAIALAAWIGWLL